ncbi:protein RER1-like [Oscarella lobularis]|uniref:protein RER1-like n=1 Tax=Oscarella lobularis TaxID=121494 RepID=UPI00331317A4
MEEETPLSQPSIFSRFATAISRRYQKLLDDLVPQRALRWIGTTVLAVLYSVRVYLLEGWYIITYALGIYVLNLLIAFLSPKIDPAVAEIETDDDGPELPTQANAEFRPFIRRLPEFKFWYGVTRGILIAMFCTLFEAFNVPVFWPILVVYFIILFTITMKRQIKHMIKYRYLPFSHGKTRYKGKDDTGAVVSQ